MTIGLVPEPMVYLVGSLLIVLLVGTTLYFKQWEWTRVKASEARSPCLGVWGVTAVTLALLRRGATWGHVVIPVLSVIVSIGTF